MGIPFPNFDPVAIEIGPLAIRWYGIAYAVSFFLGLSYISALLKRDRLWAGGKAPAAMLQHVDTLLIYIVVGVIVGGRLGHVIFYQLDDYMMDPLAILAIWKGGMSFHGGLLGVVVAVILFARVHHIDKWIVGDLIAAATPIGLLLGRLANFINGEIVGSKTTVPWAMVFPGYDGPRHPAMLYEAALEGLALFAILAVFIFRGRTLQRPGLTAGLFLVGYGIFRTFCELFKIIPARQIDPSLPITTGMVLCVPMILIGTWLIVTRLKTGNNEETGKVSEQTPAA